MIVYYTDGVRLATEERFEAARVKFEAALAAEPDHDPSLYELANVLRETGHTEEALAASARAVALDPGNRWYRGQQGRLLVTLERWDEALTLFREMVADGGDPDDYRMLALLYYHKKRTDDALAALDSAAVKIGVTGDIVELKRGILIEAGRVDQAAAVTEAYVARTPYDEENRLALAGIYGYQRRDSLQEATLKQVARINPDNAEALTMLADMYQMQGRSTLYLATLKQLFTLPEVPFERKSERLEILAGNVNFYRNHFFEVGQLALLLVTGHPGEARAVGFYADHAARGGDTEGALAVLKSRLARPDPPLELFVKTIRIETYLERADSVAAWSERALRAHPGEIEIYLMRSGAMGYLKRYKEAHKTLTRGLRVATTDSLRSEVHGAIGNLWHERGNNRKTFASYDRALAYRYDNALVLNNYAYFLAEEGVDLERALKMAKRAVGLQENFATYLDTCAWVLYKMGNYAEARRVMQQALPLDRDGSPELLAHYGDILWALKEKFMASVYWRRALEAGHEAPDEIEGRLKRMEN